MTGWLQRAGRAVAAALSTVGHALAGAPAYRFDSTPKPIADLLSDLNGMSTRRVSRDIALSVPAVLRGRNEVCSIATLPLILLRGLDRVDHPLFRQIDPDVANVVTMTRTVEDLIFEGVAWWQKTSLDFDGYPLSARWVPTWKVTVEPPKGDRTDPAEAGRWVWVDGKRIPATQMIRFDSPNPALCTAMARPIRRAVLLDQLASTYAENPRPLDYFTDSDAVIEGRVEPLQDPEITPFLSKWRNEVRRSATGWMPSKVKRVDVNAPSLRDLQLADQLKQSTIEIANALSVDPEDLGVSTTSRTYFNAQDRRISKINEGRRAIMRAITDRLSMGDITRRGYTVMFDLAEYLEADPAAQATYWEALQRMGVTDAAEIRRWAKLPGPPPAGRDTSAAAGVDASAGRPAIRLGDVTPPRALPGHRFADSDAGWQFSSADFADAPAAPDVDQEKRTITGLAMPYGQVANKFGVKYRFLPGSIEWGEHVKHFMDHAIPVGNMISAESSKTGLTVKLSVSSGIEGSPAKLQRDQLLYDAQHGLYNGLSVGVDFEPFDRDGNPLDATLNEADGVWDVHRATLREVSTTSMPAMTDARVTKVAASLTGGFSVTCQHCGGQHAPNVACATYRANLAAAHAAQFGQPAPQPTTPPAPPQPGPTNPGNPAPAGPPPSTGHNPLPQAPTFNVGDPGNLALFAAWMQQNGGALPTAAQAVSAAPSFSVEVREPDPYWIDTRGRIRKGTHDFSSDLYSGWEKHDAGARDRAQAFVRQAFADGGALRTAAAAAAEEAGQTFAVTSGNVAALNPNRNRPDLYVDQMEYTYPLWEAVNRGPLEDITPFVVPKFNTATGLVNNHVEGTEPTPGAFTATSQTITPSAVSGKVEYTREAWDQGGNPQASGIIWRQMVRGYYEALEAYAQSSLTALAGSITDLTVTTAAVDATLDQALAGVIIPLNFQRGGNRFRTAFTQVDLYTKMAIAKDTAGRRLYPEIGPQNAVGEVQAGYRGIYAHGVNWLPAWATAASGSVPASSWLFDPDGVAGWATAPQRIDIEWRVAWVDIGIWGYKAFALLDANKVREVVYDPV